MSKLFIANTSQHEQVINFWVRGNQRPFSETIPMGQQKAVYNHPHASQSDHEHIVEQLSLYGLIEVKKIGNLKTYSGLCYQFEKPIDFEAITDGIQETADYVADEALESRKQSALAVNEALQQMSGGKVAHLETEISEVAKDGQNKDLLKETIAVDSGKGTKRKG